MWRIPAEHPSRDYAELAIWTYRKSRAFGELARHSLGLGINSRSAHRHPQGEGAELSLKATQRLFSLGWFARRKRPVAFATEFRKILSSGRQVPCRQFRPASLAKIEEKVHRAGTREIPDFRE